MGQRKAEKNEGSMKKRMILCGMANSYFFPAIEEVSSVFSRPDSKIFMFLAKAFRELHLPQAIFWGSEWKKRIAFTDEIVIFDLGYQPGMEKWIKRKNPNVRVFLYIWNPIDNKRKLMKMNSFSDRESIFSTDPDDCRQYNLKYNSIFYSKKWVESVKEDCCVDCEDRIALWVGRNKNRANQLEKIGKILEEAGITPDIRISGVSENHPYYLDKEMNYSDYCQLVRKATVLLDFAQKGQAALTLRVMEAVFFQKKLITNNANIRNQPFFRQENILVIDDNSVTSSAIRDFLDIPFVPYEESIVSSFDVDEWWNNFSGEE